MKAKAILVLSLMPNGSLILASRQQAAEDWYNKGIALVIHGKLEALAAQL